MYIDCESIKNSLTGVDFIFLDTVDSTNEYLKREFKNGNIRSNTVVLARSQTKGKGTHGRVWLDDSESCLKFSIGYFLKKKNSSLAALSPVIALELTEKIKEKFKINDLNVKWPNDLYKGGKKVSGILLELIEDSESLFLVIGVGINVFKSKQLTEELDRPVSTLFDHITEDAEQIRTEVFCVCVESILNTIKKIKTPIEPKVLAKWNNYDLLFNKDICFCEAGTEINGRECGIDGFGRLKLEREEKIEFLSSGQIRLPL